MSGKISARESMRLPAKIEALIYTKQLKVLYGSLGKI